MKNPIFLNLRLHRTSVRWLFSIAAASVLVTVSSTAQAEYEASEIVPASVALKAKTATNGYKSAGLLKPRKTYLGRAAYICSPSGFGRTSSCRLRVSYN